ncbi:hypothetical protein D9757_007771 [Collybiopsis confluens]|uniref:Uncharacterized protein n=1 Tax=Collybiopsis confluens TaxID=2823264 RepID=A0A8H5MB09_9AGAR|nr:hypothetical protein D9757_007771 [Collybiopsis confluens]
MSAAIWVAWNTLSPPPGVGEVDETDVYGTFGSISSVVLERAVDRNIGWFGGRKRPAGEVNLDMDRDSVTAHVGKTSRRESLDGRDRIGAGSQALKTYLVYLEQRDWSHVTETWRGFLAPSTSSLPDADDSLHPSEHTKIPGFSTSISSSSHPVSSMPENSSEGGDGDKRRQ